jgi:hypothetical protein
LLVWEVGAALVPVAVGPEDVEFPAL